MAEARDMTLYMYNPKWYPGGKRPYMSKENLLSYLAGYQIGAISPDSVYIPNSPEDAVYFDLPDTSAVRACTFFRIYDGLDGTSASYCYFVVRSKLISSGTCRIYVQYDGFMSYCLTLGPNYITLTQAHIVGAHGGGIPAANAEAPNTAILPVGMMEVTTTQALNLLEVTPLTSVVRLIVAMTFEQGPSDDPRRNFIFIVKGTFTDAAGIVATLVQAYNTKELVLLFCLSWILTYHPYHVLNSKSKSLFNSSISTGLGLNVVTLSSKCMSQNNFPSEFLQQEIASFSFCCSSSGVTPLFIDAN